MLALACVLFRNRLLTLIPFYKFTPFHKPMSSKGKSVTPVPLKTRWHDQSKINTTLCFTSQLDLLVKPIPIPCMFLIGKVLSHHFFFSRNEETNLNQSESNRGITFYSHLKIAPGRFPNDCWKPTAKVTTLSNRNTSIQRDQPIRIRLAITCDLLKARERSRIQGAISFGFAFHWLKNWREIFKPITKRSNRSRAFTFDSYMKTAQSSFITRFSNDIATKEITPANQNS